MDSTLSQTLKADLYRYRGKTEQTFLPFGLPPRPRIPLHLLPPQGRPLQRQKTFLRHLRIPLQPNPPQSLPFSLRVRNRRLHPHGRGFYLGHFGGVVISPQAILGANVNINQGVTIGAASRGKRLGAPTLEDRVWVGANAVIVGKVTIGREALIAPGAYVNFDVPPKSVVLGNPGKVVSDTGSEGYVNRTMDE